MAIYGSADSLARNPSVVGPQAATAERAAYNPDPFNWKGIAAQLKAEEAARNAAKTRIQTPSAPHAVAQSAPPDPFAGMTPKQQLDFFRSFNNGALPPGMTPDMAAMIDQGIDIQSIAATNPAIAGVMAQLQGLITSAPADYAAGKASVNQAYDQYTGDVLDSGKNWMQDLYGRIVDPNDPNAALAQQDPALTQYAQGMSTIDETSDQNRATDLAWFDKMQQNQDATYKGLLASLAAQAATAAAAKKGGGGGGGRRRGGGGGSGGGKVNGWTVPKTVLTNDQLGTDEGKDTNLANNPGFFDDLVAKTNGDPDLQALALSKFLASGQNPVALSQDVEKARIGAETDIENLNQQDVMHQDWVQNTPYQTQSAITQMLHNRGAVLGDDPSTPGKTEQYYRVNSQGDSVGNAGTPYNPTPEEIAQNDLADILLGKRSDFGAKELTNKFFLGGKPQKMPGMLSQEGQLEWGSKGAVSPRQIQELAIRGAKEQALASKGSSKEAPFDMRTWAEGGGFVPKTHPEDIRSAEKNIGMYDTLQEIIAKWNPNITLAPRSRTVTSSDKRSSDLKTTNNSKSWGNALTGSPLDLTQPIPDSTIASNPASNPAGYDIVQGDTPGDETVLGGGGTSLQGLRLPTAKVEGLKAAAAKLIADRQNQDSIANVFGGRTIGKQPVGVLKTAAAPAPVGGLDWSTGKYQQKGDTTKRIPARKDAAPKKSAAKKPATSSRVFRS